MQYSVFASITVSQGKRFPDSTLFREEFFVQRFGYDNLLIVIQVTESTIDTVVAEEVEEERVIDGYARQTFHTFHGMFQLVVVIHMAGGELINRFHLVETVEVVGHVAFGHPVVEALTVGVVLHAVHPFGVREAPVVVPVITHLRHEDHEDGQGNGEAEEVEDEWGFRGVFHFYLGFWFLVYPRARCASPWRHIPGLTAFTLG